MLFLTMYATKAGYKFLFTCIRNIDIFNKNDIHDEWIISEFNHRFLFFIFFIWTEFYWFCLNKKKTLFTRNVILLTLDQWYKKKSNGCSLIVNFLGHHHHFNKINSFFFVDHSIINIFDAVSAIMWTLIHRYSNDNGFSMNL